MEGFNDGSNDGNELVKGSIDDDGTWLVEGSNDGFPSIFCNSLALSDAAVWWTNSSMMQCFA